MTYSQFDPAAQNRVPWNFGAKIGPKRPFNQKQIWAIRFFLDREKRIRDRKTGRPVQFEIASDARESLFAWLERRGGSVEDYVFPSRVDHSRHLSTRQYARLVDEWVEAIGLRQQEYGTHSLRRTKASIIYKATGNLRAIQILLGHSKLENTVRYLGVDIEDALTLAEKTEI